MNFAALIRFSYIFSGFLIVAFGQSAWISWLGPFAAVIGYALFWRGMLEWKSTARRIWISVIWFTAVQSIQLSWMTSTEYMGPLIWVVYACLVLALGLQFGGLCWFVGQPGALTWLRMLGIAGLWVILEWTRLFLLTGFTWNLAGLALTTWSVPLQMASLFGIYGLSFWVILVNLAGLRASFLRTRSAVLAWTACALAPFAFGLLQMAIFSRSGSTLSALLVQTSLLPEERDFDPLRPEEHLSPLIQWDRVLSLIEDAKLNQIDLIVLPEGALPYDAYQPVYPYFDVQRIWMKHFGTGAQKDFPALGQPLFRPMSRLIERDSFSRWNVSNSFWIQSIANHYGCEVIAGLDDRDAQTRKHYNAAFHFTPHRHLAERSEKRILVPIGEYVPLKEWRLFSRYISDQFGVGDSFEAGSEAKVFSGRVPIGVSICYEETYSALIREQRMKGAEMFVNISNDVWFPDSRLPRQHFDHGIVRAVENGVPSIRACNTGVTGGVDCFGRVLAIYPDSLPGSLAVQVPLHTFPTFYRLWGDWAILLLSALFAVLLFRKKEEVLPEIKSVD